MPFTPASEAHSHWIALVVGNTRLHWGLFSKQKLVKVRHTPHLATAQDAQTFVSNGFSYGEGEQIASELPSLWVASVVPEQTVLCQQSSVTCYTVTRNRLPLSNVYATLGIDRAINLLGAKERIGCPVLVVDAGTALTFTAGYLNSEFATVYGGAILPGLRLQTESLSQGTATLADAIAPIKQALSAGLEDPSGSIGTELPQRWANDTQGAIASGIIFGTLAALVDRLNEWWRGFAQGRVVLTGGDGPLLYRLLQQKTPAIAARVLLDSDLMFYGILAYRQHVISQQEAELSNAKNH